jgi:hypothetical protein
MPISTTEPGRLLNNWHFCQFPPARAQRQATKHIYFQSVDLLIGGAGRRCARVRKEVEHTGPPSVRIEGMSILKPADVNPPRQVLITRPPPNLLI